MTLQTQNTAGTTLLRRVRRLGQDGGGEVDVLMRNGRIAAVHPALQLVPDAAVDETIDVDGAYATPGWIDMHAHVFTSGMPMARRVDDAGVRAGVTTVVDAGSAGWSNFPAFRRGDIAPALTEVVAFLHIGNSGLSSYAAGIAELHDIEAAQVDRTIACIEANRDVIVGVKVRLTPKVLADHKDIWQRAASAARSTGLPMMVHITDVGSEELRYVIERLEPGDVLTHVYDVNTMPDALTPDGRLQPWMADALERGVRLDVGHGGSHFDPEFIRGALDAGLRPHTLGTDNHAPRPDQDHAVADMADVLSTFVSLGLSLDEALAGVTSGCLVTLGRAPRGVQVGDPADLTIFDMLDGGARFTDDTVTELPDGIRIQPRHTVIGGSVIPCAR